MGCDFVPMWFCSHDDPTFPSSSSFKNVREDLLILFTSVLCQCYIYVVCCSAYINLGHERSVNIMLFSHCRGISPECLCCVVVSIKSRSVPSQCILSFQRIDAIIQSPQFTV